MDYFDHSATTPVHPQVLATYVKVAEDYFANPSSPHPLGDQAHALLDQARSQVAQILAFESDEIYFTSSGTESNNWALQRIALAQRRYHPTRQQILISAVEHASILQQVDQLEALGFEVVLLPVDSQGQIDLDQFRALFTSQVLMVSTMAVNNEVGTIQPLKAIAALLADHPQILWHVDGIQAVTSHLSLLKDNRIDLISLSSHKFHSVRGVGILAMRQRVPKLPLLYGGGQEGGLRSSTENLPAIAACAKALRLADQIQEESRAKLEGFRHQVVKVLQASGWQVFGGAQTTGHIICTSYPGVPGEVLVNAFAQEQVMVSTTSACSSRKASSHVTLHAMGVAEEVARSAIRISMASTTSQDQIDRLLAAIPVVTHQVNQA